MNSIDTSSKFINNDEIDIKEILKVIWGKKKFLASIIIFMSLIFVLISFLIPNKYESTFLMVADEESTMEGSLSQYSALAGIAGVIPSETSQGQIGIEILKSRILIEKFINKYDLLVPLFASKYWDDETQELILDKNIYDPKLKKWTRDISPPFGLVPSNYEAYELWTEDIFSYDYDTKSGFIKVSIKHHSPFIAKQWAELLVLELNNYMRKVAVDEAKLSIEYLESEIVKTQSEELKLLFYKLIQSKTEKNMLAYSRDEYLFRVLDPPFLPEIPYSPNRLLIIVIGSIIGFIFGVVVILYREISSN